MFCSDLMFVCVYGRSRYNLNVAIIMLQCEQLTALNRPVCIEEDVTSHVMFTEVITGMDATH